MAMSEAKASAASNLNPARNPSKKIVTKSKAQIIKLSFMVNAIFLHNKSLKNGI